MKIIKKKKTKRKKYNLIHQTIDYFMESLKFVDSHAHLTAEAFDNDRDIIISKLEENNIETVITVADSPDCFNLIKDLTDKYPFIYGTSGYHPHYADNFKNSDIIEIKQMFKNPKIKALGEIGLDYHYTFSNRENQINLFQTLLNTATELNKPVIIHNRKSSEDMLSILNEFASKNIKGIIHCFDSDIKTAKKFLDMGFYISFSGIVCFKNSSDLRKVAEYVPLNRLLIETDCPYLAPPPNRGKRNEPAFVKYVAKEIAAIKKLNIQEIAGETKKNTYKLLEIDFELS
jgi:TatD DNase family protein